MRSRCIAVLGGCVLLQVAAAQQRSTGDWPLYAGNLAGTKYSTLKQINTKNVSQLAQAWSYRLADRGAFETTPIVASGTMYLPAAPLGLVTGLPEGKQNAQRRLGGIDRDCWWAAVHRCNQRWPLPGL
jgi:hypothetical protein